MKKLFFLCLFSLIMIFAVFGQTKRDDIVKLLEITNTKEQAIQMFDLVMPNLQAIAPGAPSSFWRTFRNMMDIDGFVAMYIPIYDRHFSHDDIKALIGFYESPIGRKLLEVTPNITQESYNIGIEWGQKLGNDIINELMKNGYY